MREIILASCNGNTFSKHEKVVAYNIFTNDRYRKFIGVCIDKLSEETTLSGDETARKQVLGNYVFYNVGEYRVEAQIQDFAKISLWDEKEDEARLRRERKYDISVA